MLKTPPTAVRAALVLAAALAALTGCAPSEPAPPADNATYEQRFDAWQTKYDACMREAGMPIPERTNGTQLLDLDTAGVDFDELQAASRGCTDRVGAAPVNPDLPTAQESYEMQLVFAKCMRRAGYEWEDPTPPDADGQSGFSSAGKAISPDEYDDVELGRCAEEAGYDEIGTGRG